MSAELEGYYSARAPEYDRVYSKPERQDDLRKIEQWLPETLAGARLVEVACGTGYWSQFLAPVVPELVAFDASQEVIEIAKARVSARHVSFNLGDAYRLPGGGVQYGAAFAGFWLSHVPYERMYEFFQSFHRVLAPGAKVVLLDNRFVEGSSTPISERDAQGNTYQMRKLEDGSAHKVLKNFPSEQALREMAAPFAKSLAFHEWRYFWALEYRLAA